MTQLHHRLARLEARDVAGEGRAAAWQRVLAPIAAGEGDPNAFPSALARLLLTDLGSAKTRGRAPAFLDALSEFGRNGANRAPVPVQ